ncbi:MAG: hypothetical protein J3K34DRAFT_435349 [Monoraphidium minutum]|nr:MAG: hypothetical protein J3K34DRAFT_435349 [Monoraphidium minutum]
MRGAARPCSAPAPRPPSSVSPNRTRLRRAAATLLRLAGAWFSVPGAVYEPPPLLLAPHDLYKSRRHRGAHRRALRRCVCAWRFLCAAPDMTITTGRLSGMMPRCSRPGGLGWWRLPCPPGLTCRAIFDARLLAFPSEEGGPHPPRTQNNPVARSLSAGRRPPTL